MVAIFFRVTCVTRRPKTQCLEHNKCSFSHNNLKQELRARERNRGLALCSFSGTQAKFLSVVFKQLPVNYGGLHLLSSSQRESRSVEECVCWHSLLARPRSLTHCIAPSVGGELVTWPYLIAGETGECIVAGHVATSFLWKEGGLYWSGQLASPAISILVSYQQFYLNMN